MLKLSIKGHQIAESLTFLVHACAHHAEVVFLTLHLHTLALRARGKGNLKAGVGTFFM